VSDPNGARPVAAAEVGGEIAQRPPAPEGTEQAGLPAPSLGPPGPMTPVGLLAPAVLPSDMDVEKVSRTKSKAIETFSLACWR